MFMVQKINQQGLQLLKSFEGLALEAIRDELGVWMIGYGHTDGVVEGSRVTEEEAEALLLEELHNIEIGVDDLLRTPLNENEFSATVCLAYNIGLDALAHSAFIKRLDKGDRLGAADALEWWAEIEIDNQEIELAGLKRRRAAEKALFLTPAANEAATLSIADNTRLQPHEENSPRRDRLLSSRTIRAMLTAIILGAIEVTRAYVEGKDASAIANGAARSIVEFLQGLSSESYLVLGGLALLLMLYVVIIRVDDWRKHKR